MDGGREPGRTLEGPRPSAFVSYAHDSHDHKRDVSRLCEMLTGSGVTVWWDRLAEGRVNWADLTLSKIRECDYVLAIASEGYRRSGDGLAPSSEHPNVRAEIDLLREMLSEDRLTWTRKILPVILPGHSLAEIPLFLHPRNETHYKVSDFTTDGAKSLLRVLRGQSRGDLRWSASGASPADEEEKVTLTLADSAGQGNDGVMNRWARFAVVDHETLFGIDAKLDELGTWLANKDGSWIISIFGGPGAGKTTLAYETVRQHAHRSGFQRIAWVSAKPSHITSSGNIEKERRVVNNWRDMLHDISDQLQLDVSPNPIRIQEEVARSLSRLADSHPCLIVIDNLESVEDARGIIKYFETESLLRPHKLILTTREMAGAYSDAVWETRWDGLDDSAARSYAGYLGRDEPDLNLSREDLDAIVVASECVPLLIKLIVKLAIFERKPISRVVGQMRDRRTGPGLNIGSYLYEQSLDALSGKVGDDAAGRLINVFCVKAAGESYSDYELIQISGLSVDVFEEAKAAACGLSLVRSMDGNSRYTVHSLFREFVCNECLNGN